LRGGRDHRFRRNRVITRRGKRTRWKFGGNTVARALNEAPSPSWISREIISAINRMNVPARDTVGALARAEFSNDRARACEAIARPLA